MTQLEQGQKGAPWASAGVKAVCYGCGGEFQPVRENQRHCRPSCRQKAIERRRGKKPPLPMLPWDESESHQSVNAKMAEYFKARAGRWIPGPELMQIGGYGGWRTRISELRHPPWNLPISQPPRYVPVTLASGKRVRISEYRLALPAEVSQAVQDHEATV